MKTLMKIFLHYALGMVLSLLVIGIIHLYSFIMQPYFCYASWENIAITTLITGFPFGIGIWALRKFKK